MVAKALVAEECRKREAREAFPLSSVAVSIQASQEFTKSSQLDSDESEICCLCYIFCTYLSIYSYCFAISVPVLLLYALCGYSCLLLLYCFALLYLASYLSLLCVVIFNTFSKKLHWLLMLQLPYPGVVLNF